MGTIGAHWVPRGLLLAGLGCAALLLSSCHVPKTFAVNSTADAVDAAPGDGACATATGECTLRAAVQEANAQSARATIELQPAHYVLAITGANEDGAATGDLDVLTPLTIDGNGATIDADQLDRAFDLPAAAATDAALTLDHVTVMRGLAGSGGGLHVGVGTLTLVDGSVVNNLATKGGGVAVEGGTLDLERSEISNNSALLSGSPHAGGGLYASGGSTVTGVNVLFDANSTAGDSSSRGGNVAEDGAQLLLQYATLLDGVSPTGANVWGSNAGFVHLGASVLQTQSGANCSGVVGSIGYSMASDSSCSSFTNATDLQNTRVTSGSTSPDSNGGPTETFRPPATSAAVVQPVPAGTAGLCDTTFPQTDQRGAPRWSGAGCDRGSFEVQLTPQLWTVNTASDGRDANPGDGVCATPAGTCSLRAAIDEANTWVERDDITLAAGTNPTLTLPGTGEDGNADGDLDVRSEIALHGNGATVTAGPSERVVDQGRGSLNADHVAFVGGHDSDGGDVRILAGQAAFDHAVIGGGHASDRGGALFVEGRAAATLDESTVRDNVATSFGGGIYDNTGQVTITRSTLSGNQVTNASSGAGGAVYSADIGFSDPTVLTTISQSTLSGNHAGARGGAVSGRLHMSFVTVAGNAAGDGSSLDDGTFSIAPLAITDSLLSGGSPLCSSGTVAGKTGNKFSDTSCQPGDPTAVAEPPHLGPLADNGGPTQTHLPFADSPGVDSIDPVGGICDGGATTDQRGLPRPAGPRCDTGAVERQPSDP